MIRLGKLEKGILELSREVAETYTHWYARFDAAAWDRKLEEDIKDGKLDQLAEEAISEHNRGKNRVF